MFNNKGFTLLEIIIVVALIGILTAIATPNLKTFLKSQKVSSEAYNVRSALQIAKLNAVKNQRDVVVIFTEGTGNTGVYEACVDDGSGACLAGISSLISGSMNATITMDAIAFGSSSESWVRFNLMGLATGSNGTVRFTDSDNTIYKQVSVSQSGNITIEKSTDGITWTD